MSTAINYITAAVIHRREAGTAAATAAGDGTARSLHALSTVAAAGCEIPFSEIPSQEKEVAGLACDPQPERRKEGRKERSHTDSQGRGNRGKGNGERPGWRLR